MSVIVAKRLDVLRCTWYGGRPRPIRFCVQQEPSCSIKKGRPTPTQFLDHVYCGQTAGCIKMPLGMEVLCVRWGPNPLLKKGAETPILGPCLLRSDGCMDQDATCYGGRPRLRRHCVRCGPSSPSPKRGQSPLPNFRLMSIVAKQLDGSRWHLAWRWALVQATLC